MTVVSLEMSDEPFLSMKNIRLIHFIVLKEKNFDNTTFVKHCIIIVFL